MLHTTGIFFFPFNMPVHFFIGKNNKTGQQQQQNQPQSKDIAELLIADLPIPFHVYLPSNFSSAVTTAPGKLTYLFY